MEFEADKVKVTDEIRKFCRDNYILPAKREKALVVAIRSGDVHDALNYKNRLPAVCAALGSNLFEEHNNIRRLAIDGPLNGASTVFVFRL